MNTRKLRKVLLTLCSALLLVSLSVGITVAYLTASDEVVNTFTVGSVAITLDEAKVNTAGEPVDKEGKTEDQVDDWKPADRVKANEYKLIPGRTYTKDPTITVAAGSEDCWVRAKVTINCQKVLDEIFAPGIKLDTILTGTSANWEYKGYTTEGDSRIYELWYEAIVPTSSTATTLDPVFTNLVMPGTVSSTDIAKLEEAGLKISVVAEAIQAVGFEDKNGNGTADEAWAAFPVTTK